MLLSCAYKTYLLYYLIKETYWNSGMKKEEFAKLLPHDGFLKISKTGRKQLPSGDRASLIRKGNEQYNAGNIELAKRIFITTGYSDGLIRVGDWYQKSGDCLEALRLYWLAPAPDKVEVIMEKTASVVRGWLSEGE